MITSPHDIYIIVMAALNFSLTKGWINFVEADATRSTHFDHVRSSSIEVETAPRYRVDKFLASARAG